MGEITLESCLEDVEARFLYILPESELAKSDRLFFQIEQAFYFYVGIPSLFVYLFKEDFYADNYSHLRHFKSLKSFAEIVFVHCPLLSKIHEKFDELFEDFGAYKSEIPVCGCILLNQAMDKIVLVCNWNGKSWTFPRGKIDEGETSFDCAMREVLEETGFDARAHCKEEDVLISMIDNKSIRLFVGTNVPEDTFFMPRVRKEISKIEFHRIDSLPKNTYSVLPFLSNLKRWISIQKRKSPLSRTPPRNNGSARKSKKTTSNNSNNVQNSLKGFDLRNNETFNEENQSSSDANVSGRKGWKVHEMFEANAKLTGKDYRYDGNPHSFGSTHPVFRDYRKVTPPKVKPTEEINDIDALFPKFVFDIDDIMKAVDSALCT